ncbi:unnamed protein product [Cylindrotheca closterium]|uniref:Uncharacterized protein n=1 Tax=Cylindrotheca closterium TaxID=2856 RepID=A0AAD2FV44_9STRA|nr:unnamed protein product [Cylindrotheca closterium]
MIGDGHIFHPNTSALAQLFWAPCNKNCIAMKEEVQNGPLMDQHQRQKGYNLPPVKTVFGTVEEILEQRTEESDANTYQDGSRGVMSEDEISGMVQDALFKARKATQSLSPHKQSSGAQKPYTSFFPSLENMISTSRSTTLQHAQSLLNGKTTVSPSTDSQRDQPDGYVIYENPSEQTGGYGGVEHAAQSAAMKYVQTMSPSANMMANPSDYVIRKVEDEIANAKKVAQEAFNRVKCGGASNEEIERNPPQIVDLTDAEDVQTFDDRETIQLAASSTWRSEGPNSTWRSEGPHSTWRSEGPSSTWRSAEDGEEPLDSMVLDSMVSEDYGLVYGYSVAPSMSSIGQPTVFCSLDNPIIRAMEHTAAGMNIIDLTNHVEYVSPPRSRDAQLRAVSPTQNSVTSVGSEDFGPLNAIEKVDTSEKRDMKKTRVKTYPILPLSQETTVKALEDSRKSDTEKADIKMAAAVSMKQESRADRLRKLRQPMHIVKEDSHEDSQGNPDDQDKMTLDQGTEVPANDCMDKEMVAKKQKDSDDKVESKENQEAADEEANDESVTEQQAEKTFTNSVETAEVVNDSHISKEEPVVTEPVESKATCLDENEVDAEPVTDQQVEEALIDSVETAETDEDPHSEKEESRTVKTETENETLIDLGETTEDVMEDSHNDTAESRTFRAETARDATDEGPLDLASGFGKLMSLFQDRDERKGLTFRAKSKEIGSEDNAEVISNDASVAQRPDTQAEPSTEDVNEENIEVRYDSDEVECPDNFETTSEKCLEGEGASVEESANDNTADAENMTMDEQATNIQPEGVSYVTPVQSPRNAADVIIALGGFFGGASHDNGIPVSAASEGANANALEKEPADDPEVQHDTAADVNNALGNFGASHDDGIQVAAASKGRTNADAVEEEPAKDPEVQHDTAAGAINALGNFGASRDDEIQVAGACEGHANANVVEGEPENDPEVQHDTATDVINELGNFGASHDDEIQFAAGREGHTNVIEEEPANDPEVQHDQHEKEAKHPLFAFFDAAREARARDFAALGLGFMAATEKQTESKAPLPEVIDGSMEGQQFSAVLAKSGESNEKNSLIEVAPTTPSMDGQLMPSPVPSQYTAEDNEYCEEEETSTHNVGQAEDVRHEAEAEQHDNEESTPPFDPLGSLYRTCVPEKELGPESTRVSLKNKYSDPPGEYTTRSEEDIINANRVEAPIPQLCVLEPTDEIQKLQASIMGESVTRRFNACGALKMFAMNKSNQLALARTDGFFDALIVALTTDLVGKDREAAFGTRTRALEILLRVCMQKENRVVIFYHPDLVESIVCCAAEDSGEIRMAACSVLAMIAKSGHLREPMAQVEDLLDVLAASLLGTDSQKAQPVKQLDEVHENDANYASDEFSSGSDSSSDASSSLESEISYATTSGRNKQHRQSTKLKQKEMEEKKKETKKQVTTNACAALLHLSKQCAAGHFMCHSTSLLNALLILSQQYEHPMHTKCLEILCNLTRLPSNDEILAEHPSVVPVMLRLSTSEREEDRVWALRMLQNISASAAGKHVLVSAFALELLSMSVLRTQAEEQKAAMAALFNLSTDPGCLMAITNTSDVLSSLVLVAQDMNTISEVRMMACDMLATIGLWFQKIAGGSTVPDGVKETVLPSNVTTGWKRWDEEIKC